MDEVRYRGDNRTDYYATFLHDGPTALSSVCPVRYHGFVVIGLLLYSVYPLKKHVEAGRIEFADIDFVLTQFIKFRFRLCFMLLKVDLGLHTVLVEVNLRLVFILV